MLTICVIRIRWNMLLRDIKGYVERISGPWGNYLNIRWNLLCQVREAQSLSPGRSQSQQGDPGSCGDSSSPSPREHSRIRCVANHEGHQLACRHGLPNVTCRSHFSRPERLTSTRNAPQRHYGDPALGHRMAFNYGGRGAFNRAPGLSN